MHLQLATAHELLKRAIQQVQMAHAQTNNTAEEILLLAMLADLRRHELILSQLTEHRAPREADQ